MLQCSEVANLKGLLEEYRARCESLGEPTKYHAEGCLHSSKPEMIISNEVMEEGQRTSKLARALYFRRCDGVYKNVAGERLSMRK